MFRAEFLVWLLERGSGDFLWLQTIGDVVPGAGVAKLDVVPAAQNAQVVALLPHRVK